MLLTAKDQQETLVRYLGGNNDNQALVDCRTAIVNALKEIWKRHDWPWYMGNDSLSINGPYSTGTVTYSYATRRFTLSGGTWPTWAQYGSILIGSKYSKVTKRISDTVIEIQSNTPFLADITTPTAFNMYRAAYPISGNIRKLAYMYLDQNSYTTLQYLPPIEFREKFPGALATVPRFFTVERDRYVPNGLCLILGPQPVMNYTLRFAFMRSPNEINVWSNTDGKITVVAGDKTVTGTQSSFEQGLHEQCLLRVGRNATEVPTPRTGQSAFSEELLIDTVTSPTSLEVTTDVVTARTGVKYEISSLVDIDSDIMSSVFLQQCYFELSKIRTLPDKDVTSVLRMLELGMKQARSGASTSQEITYAGSFTNAGYSGVWFQGW